MTYLFHIKLVVFMNFIICYHFFLLSLVAISVLLSRYVSLCIINLLNVNLLDVILSLWGFIGTNHHLTIFEAELIAYDSLVGHLPVHLSSKDIVLRYLGLQVRTLRMLLKKLLPQRLARRVLCLLNWTLNKIQIFLSPLLYVLNALICTLFKLVCFTLFVQSCFSIVICIIC